METNAVITKILIGGNTAVILMSVIILGLAVFYLFSSNIDYASWSRASTMIISALAIVCLALKTIPELYLKNQNVTPDMSHFFFPEFLITNSYEFITFSVICFLIIFQGKRLFLQKK